MERLEFITWSAEIGGYDCVITADYIMGVNRVHMFGIVQWSISYSEDSLRLIV